MSRLTILELSFGNIRLHQPSRMLQERLGDFCVTTMVSAVGEIGPYRAVCDIRIATKINGDPEISAEIARYTRMLQISEKLNDEIDLVGVNTLCDRMNPFDLNLVFDHLCKVATLPDRRKLGVFVK